MVPMHADDLFPRVQSPPNTCVINSRCLLRTQDGHRVVSVSGIMLAQYAIGDRMSEAHAMVSLVDQGWADQCEVARAFGCRTPPGRLDKPARRSTGPRGQGAGTGPKISMDSLGHSTPPP